MIEMCRYADYYIHMDQIHRWSIVSCDSEVHNDSWDLILSPERSNERLCWLQWGRYYWGSIKIRDGVNNRMHRRGPISLRKNRNWHSHWRLDRWRCGSLVGHALQAGGFIFPAVNYRAHGN